MNKISQEIPAKSLGYILICSGIIVVVILGIIQFYRYNSNRSQDIIKIKNQIDEQKKLGPVYLSLLKASEKKEVLALPNPAKTKLSRRDTDKFQETFRNIAGKSGLMTVFLMPDVKTMAGTSQTLLYNATLKGEFVNFRRLLIGLGDVPYIDRIDEINIKQYADSMEFKLKIWIALSN